MTDDDGTGLRRSEIVALLEVLERTFTFILKLIGKYRERLAGK